MTPRPIAYASDDSVTTDRSIRLEPFDERRFLYDIWLMVDHARESGPGKKINVRASARVAGKRFRRRSPWREKWVFEPGDQSLVPGHAPTFSELVYQTVWRRVRTDPAVEPYASVVAIDVEPLFDDGQRPDVETLRAALLKSLEDLGVDMPAELMVFDLLSGTDGRVPHAPSLKARSRTCDVPPNTR